MSVESVNVAIGGSESAPALAATAAAKKNNRLSASTISLASYDKRLNPDAPVFVPRSRTIPLSTLAQKFMHDGEDVSCGRVYDSIWREVSDTPTVQLPNMPHPMNALIRPIPLTMPTLFSSPLPPPLSIMPTLFDSTMNLYRPIARPRLQQRNFTLRRTQSQQVTSIPLNIDAPEYVPHFRRANSNVGDSTGTLVTMELPKVEKATINLLEENESEPEPEHSAAQDNEIVVTEAVEAGDADPQQKQQQQEQQELQSPLSLTLPAQAKCLAKSTQSFQPGRKHYDNDSSDDEGRSGCCCSIM